MSARQIVLDRAAADYEPDLVCIDFSRVETIDWPDNGSRPMDIRIAGKAGATPHAAMHFLIALCSINFKFWTRDPDGSLARYTHLGNTGARALWAAFEQCWSVAGQSYRGFHKRLEDEGVEALFGAIPNPADRRHILSGVLAGDTLDTFARWLREDIEHSGEVTVAQAMALAKTYPAAFNDPYLKKAQLALSMIAGFLRHGGKPVGTDDLTAFADYQIPRVLRALGVIKYGASLASRIDGSAVMPEDTPEELAIRAATILACESIATRIGGSPADVDNLLWQSQSIAGDAKFHLTPTARY